MTDQTRNFIGIPVNGSITRGETRVEQRPIEELQPVMQAVLDDPTVVAYGWTQYTPYFDDGKPCTFCVNSLWVRTDSDREADQYELEMWGHKSLGERPKTWNHETNSYDYGAYEGPDEARYDRCKQLEKAIEGGHFENVLLDAFGDHAEVTVRRDGIEIEFYQHD